MIEKYIKHLLFEHDCVVIPEFGGFIANYVGAEIHPIHHTFQPPSKNIAFNEMLKLNDGLLISHVSTHEGISREEAQRAVKDYTEFIKSEIRSKDKYKFEEIGTLYLNHEQKLQFEPENKINYLSSSFGLPQLEYKPIERASSYTKFKSKDRPAMINEENLNDQFLFTGEKKRSRSKIILAILIPILLLLAGSAGYFLFLDNGKTALSSFDPFISLKGNTMEEDTTAIEDDSFLYADSTLQANQDIDADTTITDDAWTSGTETIADDTQSEAAWEETKTTTSNNASKEAVETPALQPVSESAPEAANGIAVASEPPRFYVIIGGFSVKENAYKLKDQLFSKGNTAAKVILPNQEGNLLKVSYADFDAFNIAASKAEELKGEYGSSVWVFKY